MKECQDTINDFRLIGGITLAKVLKCFKMNEHGSIRNFSIPLAGPTIVGTSYTPLHKTIPFFKALCQEELL